MIIFTDPSTLRLNPLCLVCQNLVVSLIEFETLLRRVLLCSYMAEDDLATRDTILLGTVTDELIGLLKVDLIWHVGSLAHRSVSIPLGHLIRTAARQSG